MITTDTFTLSSDGLTEYDVCSQPNCTTKNIKIIENIIGRVGKGWGAGGGGGGGGGEGDNKGMKKVGVWVWAKWEVRKVFGCCFKFTCLLSSLHILTLFIINSSLVSVFAV